MYQLIFPVFELISANPVKALRRSILTCLEIYQFTERAYLGSVAKVIENNRGSEGIILRSLIFFVNS